MNNLVVSNLNNLPNGKRVKPSVKELKAMIDKEIDWVVAAKKDFTAYNITLLLRNNYPMLEIVHENVRKYVHNKMDKYSQWSKLAWSYDSKVMNYNGEDAVTYFPLLQTVIGSVASAPVGTPAIPAPVSPVIKVDKEKKAAPAQQVVRSLPAPNNIRIDWGDD